jgi:hypothetical protein
MRFVTLTGSFPPFSFSFSATTICWSFLLSCLWNPLSKIRSYVLWWHETGPRTQNALWETILERNPLILPSECWNWFHSSCKQKETQNMRRIFLWTSQRH